MSFSMSYVPTNRNVNCFENNTVSNERTVVQPPGDQRGLQEGQHRYPRRQRWQTVRYGIDEYVDMSCIGEAEDPESIEEALQSRLSKKWQEAVPVTDRQ